MTASLDPGLDVLRTLLSQPTAPFHEQRVAAAVVGLLRQWNIAFTVDGTGAIIARYQRGAPCPPLVLMAHMDHPAFTLVARGGAGAETWVAQVEGGMNPDCFKRTSPVRLFPGSATAAADQYVQGRIIG